MHVYALDFPTPQPTLSSSPNITSYPHQDINLRLPTLPPPPRSSHPSYPLHLATPVPLPQLAALLTLLNHALDIIDISTWTGDPHNGSFIAGQLKLLAETIGEAQGTMGGGEEGVAGKWWEEVLGEDVGATSGSQMLNRLSKNKPDILPSPPPHPLLPPLHLLRRPRPHPPHPRPRHRRPLLPFRLLPPPPSRPRAQIARARRE